MTHSVFCMCYSSSQHKVTNTYIVFKSIPTEEGFTRFTGDSIEVVAQSTIPTNATNLVELHSGTLLRGAFISGTYCTFTENVLHVIRAACHVCQWNRGWRKCWHCCVTLVLMMQNNSGFLLTDQTPELNTWTGHNYKQKHTLFSHTNHEKA